MVRLRIQIEEVVDAILQLGFMENDSGGDTILINGSSHCMYVFATKQPVIVFGGWGQDMPHS